MSRGPEPETSDEEILQMFVERPEPAFMAPEIAKEFDISAEGARHRLNQLVEKGYLRKKKAGQKTVIYWITPEGQEHYYTSTHSGGSEQS